MSQPASNVDRLFSGAATHRGRGHDVNEDSFGLPVGVSDAVAAQKGRLYVVSDGIGGHQAGDVASKIAVDTVQRVYYEDPSPTPDVALQRAVRIANEAIYRRAQDPGYADMGATIVAAVVRGDELTVAHVGDSRVYLLRQGQLQALTADHSWVADQVRSGTLTPSEAANHNMRHVVTRSLGSSSTVEVDVAQFVLHEGDRLLLCSDGIWELVSDDEVRHFLRREAPRGAAQALVDRAVAAGVPDDATALVVSVGDPRSGVLAQVESAVTSLMATQEGRIGAVLVGAFIIVALLFAGAMSVFRPAEGTPTAVSFSPTETATPVLTPEPTASQIPPTAAPVAEPTATSTLEEGSASVPEGCETIAVQNSGFESSGGWRLISDRPSYTTDYAHSGERSMELGGGQWETVVQILNLPLANPRSASLQLWLHTVNNSDGITVWLGGSRVDLHCSLTEDDLENFWQECSVDEVGQLLTGGQTELRVSSVTTAGSIPRENTRSVYIDDIELIICR